MTKNASSHCIFVLFFARWVRDRPADLPVRAVACVRNQHQRYVAVKGPSSKPRAQRASEQPAVRVAHSVKPYVHTCSQFSDRSVLYNPRYLKLHPSLAFDKLFLGDAQQAFSTFAHQLRPFVRFHSHILCHRGVPHAPSNVL